MSVSRVVAILALALLAACGAGPPESELYGVYLSTYKNGTERLTLERGGTFLQEVRLEGSDSAVTNSGTWQYDRAGKAVDLKNCLGVGDGFGRIRADFIAWRGICGPIPVGRSWVIVGQLRLGADKDSTPLWKVQ
jgi:hypothetical protein